MSTGDLLVGDPSEEQVAEQGSRVEEGGAQRWPPVVVADQVHLGLHVNEKK